ncbi:MAG: spondin domain-containing protein [Pseudomonadales bacterium]
MKKLILISALLVIAACSDNDNDNDPVPPPVTPPVTDPPPPAPANASYEISAVNLTVGQPFSPLALLIHDESQTAFEIGTAASAGLEQLAEGGDNSQFLADLDSVAETSGAAPIAPGGNETISLELDSDDPTGLRLTVMTMLVNTNDAITGVNGANIGELAVGESITFNTISYDSGTEANTELGVEIPGPISGGEGFNAARDDIRDEVMMHQGVVTADDGLASSDLGQQHRWDNPVARFQITRTQ